MALSALWQLTDEQGRCLALGLTKGGSLCQSLDPREPGSAPSHSHHDTSKQRLCASGRKAKESFFPAVLKPKWESSSSREPITPADIMLEPPHIQSEMTRARRGKSEAEKDQEPVQEMWPQPGGLRSPRNLSSFELGRRGKEKERGSLGR